MSTISAGTTSTTTLVHSGDTTGSLVFKTNDTGSGGTTAVTIDTSQNVGIGITPVSQKLEVKGNQRLVGDSAYILWRDTADSASSGVIQFPSASAATIGTYVNQAMLFQTNNTERMRIDTSGNLLVGCTAVNNTNGFSIAPSTAPYVTLNKSATGTKDAFYFEYNGAIVGKITYSDTATAYNTSSDYRLKENIQPMQNALGKVAQLNPVTYKWKLDGSDGEGFIAHELAEVCPHAVTGEKDAVDANGNPVYQGIDTSFLVATLTAALQETKALIDTQAETINALTARVVALEGK